MLRKSVSSKESRPLLHGGEVTAHDMLRSVRPETHRGLLNSIPTMLRHLREDGISDPSIFLRRDRAMEFLAGDLLRSFFTNLNKSHDMSVKLTREICAWRAPHVLACAISNVLEFSAQPLIPSETALRLLGVANGLRSVGPQKRIEMVNDVLEDMSAWRFELLTSFVCFLHDCAGPNADLAREIGPLMLLRDGVSLAAPPSRGKPIPDIVREQNQINDEMAASEVFKVMIDECFTIFNVPRGYAAPAAPPPLMGGFKQRGVQDLNSSGEEKSMLDEEKTSISSLNNLYEGIGSAPVPRRRKSKKASEFHSIIARTSSNVSGKNSVISDATPDSPISILKSNSDRFGSRRPVGVPPAGPPKPIRPSMSEQTSESASSAWQERRPPPLLTVAASSAIPNAKKSPSGGSIDSPLIQTQTSFNKGGKNPLIKTQTSFNTSSRPSTPTAVLSAKRNMLADIQARTNSPSPPPIMDQPAMTLSEALERPVASQLQSSSSAESEQRVTPPRMASSFRSPNMEEQGLPMYTGMSSFTPTLHAAAQEEAEQQKTARAMSEMDADGPTIFERETRSANGRGPRAALAPSTYASEATSATKAQDEQEEKSEEPPAFVGVSFEQSEQAVPVKPPKPPKPAKRPSQPRHSFIPRITSPRRSLTAGKTFDDILAERKELAEEEAVVANGEKPQEEEEKKASDNDERPESGDDDEPVAVEASETEEPMVLAMAPKPRPSFAEQLAARRAGVESTPGAVAEGSSTSSSAAPNAFAKELVKRRSIVETEPVATPSSTAPNAFEKELSKRRSIVESSTSTAAGGPNAFEKELARRASIVEVAAGSKRGSLVDEGKSGGTSFADQLARRRAEVEAAPGSTVAESAKPGSFEAQLAQKRRSIVEVGAVPAAAPEPAKNSFEAQLAQKRNSMVVVAGNEPKTQAGEAPVAVAAVSELRSSGEQENGGGSKPGSGSSLGSQAPPFRPRPKPVPPPLTPGVREIQRRSSMQPVEWNQTHHQREVVTLQPIPPPSPQNNGADIPVQDKLANLRALLKPSGSGSGTAPAPAPSPPPPPEDTKKRVPPPSDAPPSTQAKLDKEPGMQIIGDWRTEWSPQHKCIFWVNILTGAVQWSHPMRERSLSTKNRQEQSKNYAPEVASVTMKMPEARKTIHENKSDAKVPAKPAKPGATPIKTTPAAPAAAKAQTPQNVRSIEALGRQSSSDVQKDMHRGYRRNSIQNEDFQAQRAAQFDEADAFVIAAARAAGETIAECIFDFTPVDPNNKAEMAIKTGERLRIYEKGDDGWWGGVKISDGSQRGLFPTAYVKAI